MENARERYTFAIARSARGQNDLANVADNFRVVVERFIKIPEPKKILSVKYIASFVPYPIEPRSYTSPSKGIARSQRKLPAYGRAITLLQVDSVSPRFYNSHIVTKTIYPQLVTAHLQICGADIISSHAPSR